MRFLHFRNPFLPAVLGLVFLLFTGCLSELVKKPEIEDPWPVQVEFFPTQESVDENNSEAVVTTIEVRLVGPVPESDQRIYYTVNGEESNAINGVHYQLRTNPPVTIEAGETTADIRIDVLPGNLEKGARREVVIDLEGNDQIGTVPSHDRYTLIIEGN